MLYELRAAEDKVAHLDTPILGYSLETEYILEVMHSFLWFSDLRSVQSLGVLIDYNGV